MTKVHSYHVLPLLVFQKRQCDRIVNQPDLPLSSSRMLENPTLKNVHFLRICFQQLTQSPHLQTHKTNSHLGFNLRFACLRNTCESVMKNSRLIIMWPGVFQSIIISISWVLQCNQNGCIIEKAGWVLHIIRNSFPMRFVYDFTIMKEFIQHFWGILVMKRLSFFAVKGHLGREIWLSFIFMSYIKRDLHVFCTDCMSWRNGNKCTF